MADVVKQWSISMDESSTEALQNQSMLSLSMETAGFQWYTLVTCCHQNIGPVGRGEGLGGIQKLGSPTPQHGTLCTKEVASFEKNNE